MTVTIMKFPKKQISLSGLADSLSRSDRFRATVYAVNTLLMRKRIYTMREFELCFREWAQKNQRRKKL